MQRSFITLVLATTWGLSPVFAWDGASSGNGLQHDVVFSDYSDLSRTLEVARRTLSPLVNEEILRVSAGSGLRSQAIDLKNEKFAVYLPRRHPPQGYGVLVFIPPWQDARLPAGWGPVLDDEGVIFISAQRSGNEENIIDRRIPLAILGAYNIIQSYPVDLDRMYVGGFSGGARVAMRVALGYPDLFRGALLNSGSDPIGDKDAVLPPDTLFARFQTSSRVVYATGTDDSVNINLDMGSRASMNAWCVFGTEVHTIYRAGHEVADADTMRRALAALDLRSPVDTGKLNACRARVEKEMSAELEQVGHLLDFDKPRAAWGLLRKTDAHYAGLASPQIIDLEQRIGSRR